MNNINLLFQALNASSLRQQAISHNIANAETPKFKAKKVVFEEILKQHLTSAQNSPNGTTFNSFNNYRTDPRHVFFGNPPGMPTAQIIENTETVMNNNGNNVDLDHEMTEMGKNALWYNALSYQMNSEIQKLSIAITGRR